MPEEKIYANISEVMFYVLAKNIGRLSANDFDRDNMSLAIRILSKSDHALARAYYSLCRGSKLTFFDMVALLEGFILLFDKIRSLCRLTQVMDQDKLLESSLIMFDFLSKFSAVPQPNSVGKWMQYCTLDYATNDLMSDPKRVKFDGLQILCDSKTIELARVNCTTLCGISLENATISSISKRHRAALFSFKHPEIYYLYI